MVISFKSQQLLAMKSGRFHPLILVAMLLLGARAWAQQFESLSDFELSFQSSGSAAPHWGTRYGAGGSGGLISDSEGYIACAKSDQPLALRPGQTATVSMDFLYGKQVTRVAERNAGVFLAEKPDISPLDAIEGSALAVYFFNVGNTPGAMQTKICLSTGGGQDTTDQGDFILDTAGWWNPEELEGHWCRMKVRFTKLHEHGMWNVVVQILDVGKFADEEKELVTVEWQGLAQPLYDAAEVFAGFQNLRMGRGFNAMDEFKARTE